MKKWKEMLVTARWGKGMDNDLLIEEIESEINASKKEIYSCRHNYG